MIEVVEGVEGIEGTLPRPPDLDHLDILDHLDHFCHVNARHLLAPLSLALTVNCASAPVTPTPVTLAVVNARAWTGDARRPWADAIAVEGERIAAVGSSA